MVRAICVPSLSVSLPPMNVLPTPIPNGLGFASSVDGSSAWIRTPDIRVDQTIFLNFLLEIETTLGPVVDG